MFIDNLRVRVEKLEAAVFSNEASVIDNLEVTITAPKSATNGVLKDEDLQIITNNSASIIFNGDVFRLYDNETASGYKVYAHAHSGKFDKITVTLSTGSWVLVRG